MTDDGRRRKTGTRWGWVLLGSHRGALPMNIAEVRTASIDLCTTSAMFFARLTAVYWGEPR